MNKMRVSYSMLNAWAQGDYDRAIAMYLRKPFPSTPAMEAGKAFHAAWEQEALESKKLPAHFGELKFTKPQIEVKHEKMLNNWLELVGVLDVKDGTLGIDYKTGVLPASQYANGKQHCVYQILFPELERFEYYAYNQHTGETTMAIVHLTDKTLMDGLEFVLTNAKNMLAYCQSIELEQVMPEKAGV